MALSRVVSEIFNVEKCRDLEILKSGSEVTQGHRKCYQSIDRAWFPIRGVNGPERTGTAFRLEFMQPERRSCSSVTVFENAVPPAEQKVA